MISGRIDRLDIQSGSNILEIGFGNGKHISAISGAMITEASLNNAAPVQHRKAVFSQIAGDNILNFENDIFDYCFTVNTIYFWNSVVQQLKEIYLVLKHGGRLT